MNERPAIRSTGGADLMSLWLFSFGSIFPLIAGIVGTWVVPAQDEWPAIWLALGGALTLGWLPFTIYRTLAWHLLGEAWLLPRSPQLGKEITWRVDFERLQGSRRPATATWLCQEVTEVRERLPDGKRHKSIRRKKLWRESRTSPNSAPMEFRLALPANLPADDCRSYDGIQWWLDVKGSTPGGLPFSRRFRVPVSEKGDAWFSQPRQESGLKRNGGVLLFLGLWAVVWGWMIFAVIFAD